MTADNACGTAVVTAQTADGIDLELTDISGISLSLIGDQTGTLTMTSANSISAGKMQIGACTILGLGTFRMVTVWSGGENATSDQFTVQAGALNAITWNTADFSVLP